LEVDRTLSRAEHRTGGGRETHSDPRPEGADHTEGTGCPDGADRRRACPTTERRPDPLWELTKARLLEFVREPEAVFWVFVFPVLLAVALGIAFREQAPERARVAVESTGRPAQREMAARLRPEPMRVAAQIAAPAPPMPPAICRVIPG